MNYKIVATRQGAWVLRYIAFARLMLTNFSSNSISRPPKFYSDNDIFAYLDKISSEKWFTKEDPATIAKNIATQLNIPYKSAVYTHNITCLFNLFYPQICDITNAKVIKVKLERITETQLQYSDDFTVCGMLTMLRKKAELTSNTLLAEFIDITAAQFGLILE